ncbi:TetR family transcriptional regulator [Kitasatospora xanthocidica]|uniref:TetR/AcrR family transcriptional regulator n=1 Tax=Kitasatospora xanthocidica TaxID=83382 RepID=UPI00167BB0D2|nr:TetR/AcrR family transcriptional regulator [Kitasatospora xanthocidica]GHF28265.1 TetR family transcriptional regulator [Kitasatospora xanthocidica]
MTAKSEDGTSGIPSLWTRPQRPRRDQPALSREQIVTEALALLDSDGIDALSMRKLGARLNAGATSLYTHVTNKEELLALAVDQVFSELPLPEATGTTGDPEVWRAAIEECAEGVRALILRHPWMVSVLGDVGMVYFGPSWMRLSEAFLTLLETSGLDLATANEAMGVVMGYTIGAATVEAAWLSALAKRGRQEQEWMDQLLPSVVEATKGHPRLHRLYTTQVGREVEPDRNSHFLSGVRVILDGIEASWAARTSDRTG